MDTLCCYLAQLTKNNIVSTRKSLSNAVKCAFSHNAYIGFRTNFCDVSEECHVFWEVPWKLAAKAYPSFLQGASYDNIEGRESSKHYYIAFELSSIGICRYGRLDDFVDLRTSSVVLKCLQSLINLVFQFLVGNVLHDRCHQTLDA